MVGEPVRLDAPDHALLLVYPRDRQPDSLGRQSANFSK